MDDQLLRALYHRLFNCDKRQHDPRPTPRCTYPDALIVLIYFLAVLRDRSPHWAICPQRPKSNWPLWMRRLPCPSYGQFCRRLQSFPVQRLIALLFLEFRNQLPHSAQKYCDGKPLTVGGFSKDPDARAGRLPGDGWGKGYKVHLLADQSGAVEAFALTGLDAGEATVMRQVVPGVDLSGSVLRADSNYDSNALYAAVARGGGRLIAPRRKRGTALGHHPQHPDRLRAIAELEDGGQLRQHRRCRVRVEQELGHITNLPFGLSPLPNFVRRRHRVGLWVLAKLVLYHLCLIHRAEQKNAA